MAVAAYASLLSLSHVLDNIQHPSRHRLLPNTKQIQTLHEKLHFLQQFLELQSPTKIEQIEYLARQIAEVANEAEEIIDSHVVDRLCQEHEDKTDDDMGLSLLFSESTTGMQFSSTSFCQDIEKVIEKIDSIKEELLLTMAKENSVVQGQQSKGSVAAGPSRLPFSGENTHVVGFDEHLVRIMDQLASDQPNLQIIPIVGMGGIGKTTLARFAFANKYVVEKFDLRVWFTISQEYSAREILLGVLRDIGVHVEINSESTLAGLGQQLHKTLFGRQYLIVMDDLWSIKGWEDFKLYFPDDENGSRVIVTTRLTDVAVSLASYTPYLMNFLDENKSWNLFCEKAFGQDSCSAELEEPGKTIAKSCRGLPLSIIVIGGLLAKSNMTREYWQIVAENVISYANSENDERCLKILGLSYDHLPIHLKPCFLYMRVFPEDTEIRVSKLIKLWIAEGFLKLLGAKSLEEVAKEYLKDLIDRNLILIRGRGHTGEIKACGIHDHLRDLCIRESQKEHFLFCPKVQESDFDSKNKCFLCLKAVAQERIHLSQLHLDSGSTSLVSYFVCNACRIMYPQLVRLRMVRVGNIGYQQEKHIPQHTKLRYLSISWIGSFASPSPIPLLWNLQSLIIGSIVAHDVVLPSEIWEMPQLRHIIINHCLLPDPIELKDLTILENLQTLSAIGNFKCTENVLERIPNLKTLGICYDQHGSERVHWSYYSLYNLARLRKLESLSLECYGFVLENIAFPFSLKKLSLSRCEIPRKDMTIIGSLPNLEVLKLCFDAFTGSEWKPIEGQFLRLKFLSISHTYLKWWRADDIHFPSLETLKLRKMDSLKEIPRGIGDIGTLRLIHLVSCYHLVDSVKVILEEQRSFGNEDLQVQVL